MRRLEGVELTQENLRERTVTIRYDPATAGLDTIQQALDAGGYASTVVT